MSAAVEEPVVAAPVVAESAVVEKSEQNGNGTVQSNGDAKPTETEKKNGEAKKEKQPPIDPKEDFIGWLKQRPSAFVHEANYEILNLIGQSVEDETKRPKLPENRLVTKSEFVQHLKDGTLLCHFANVLHPGAVETVKESEEELKDKENQKFNLDAFTKFLKDTAGIDESKVFNPDELLDKGKAAYASLVDSLIALLKVIPEKFQKAKELEFDGLIDSISKIEPQNVLLRKLKEWSAFLQEKFRRTQISGKDKEVKTNGEQKSEENGVAPAEEEKKDDAPAAVVS